MNRNSIFIGLAAAIALVSMSMFTVNMTQSAVVLEFQAPKETITEPGLYFKIPFVQKVSFFSNQLLVNDSPPAEVITRDKKNLLVDSFSMWRIVDPLKFLETLRTTDSARSRLNNILYSELRVEIGTHDLIDIVTEKREKIMEKVTAEGNKKASAFGIQVAEVRIKRTDFPPEIANSIFNRMRTERERIAKEYRSEGKEEATKIRAKTDKERTILIAEAYAEEQVIRGEGDAKAIAIYAQAYKQDPKFYSFMRSMDAYRNSFNADTTILLNEDSEFLENFNKVR
ncbi:MAG: HflC protein [Nitrospinae bacterium CG11_big_fil_rev_8_21_14_0_20_45_15]|nr:MAG: HflC protein [Nitrospinae bacterium CG11_big_fil_rev_8_21_14_0_20_45_15]